MPGEFLHVAETAAALDDFLAPLAERPPLAGKETSGEASLPPAVSLISVEHPLDLLGVGRLGQRQHQQDTRLLRVERI